MANNFINFFETFSKIRRLGLNMAMRLITKLSYHKSASIITEDSEPKMDNPSSPVPVSNITQCKKTIQYIDQVQFDNMQKIIK